MLSARDCIWLARNQRLVSLGHIVKIRQARTCRQQHEQAENQYNFGYEDSIQCFSLHPLAIATSTVQRGVRLALQIKVSR